MCVYVTINEMEKLRVDIDIKSDVDNESESDGVG